eukprot:3153702-Alexandrium_andersonii.AAC.1
MAPTGQGEGGKAPDEFEPKHSPLSACIGLRAMHRVMCVTDAATSAAMEPSGTSCPLGASRT